MQWLVDGVAGFFSEFPSQWEWVALALGGVSFLMAVQPFIQAVWGRPDIRVGEGTREFDEWHLLELQILNMPIRGRLLRFFRVRRDTARSVWMSLDIRSHGSQALVHGIVAEWVERGSDRNPRQKVDIPPDFVPFSVPVATMHPHGLVTAGTPSEEPSVTLAAGLYDLEIALSAEGRRRSPTMRRFVVQGEKPFAYWVSL